MDCFEELYDEFRRDPLLRRAMKHKEKKKKTFTSQIRASNQGQPIEVTHFSFTRQENPFPFLYRFPLKKGYATLYFMGPESVWPGYLERGFPTFYDGSYVQGIPSFQKEGFVRLSAPLPLVHGESLLTRGISLYVQEISGKERCLGLTEDFFS